jgi:hypothetical protein
MALFLGGTSRRAAKSAERMLGPRCPMQGVGTVFDPTRTTFRGDVLNERWELVPTDWNVCLSWPDSGLCWAVSQWRSKSKDRESFGFFLAWCQTSIPVLSPSTHRQPVTVEHSPRHHKKKERQKDAYIPNNHNGNYSIYLATFRFLDNHNHRHRRHRSIIV